MRKNILIATVVGLCVIGMTACSRGEENKPANGETTPPTTAMTQEQAPAADQNQAVVERAQTDTLTREYRADDCTD